jgi:hypothetical protein
MKRFVVPVVAGVLVFGAATAFAASLSLNSTSLASGNATVASCNASANVSYTTAYDATIPGYKVATAPITTAAACAGLAYKVTLTGAGNVSLAEVTGTLAAVTGDATATFAPAVVSAALVTGVSVVVTG